MTSLEYRNNPMFLRNQFEGIGTFEMPKIKKEKINLENIEFIGYDKINSGTSNQIVHFFLDDYKFQVLWNNPLPRIEKLKQFKAVLAPNFSVYTEMPMAIKVYNTFRSRWCGAFLQANGVKVIPTLAWGGPETFWFCFDGIEQNAVVAVSTIGVRTEKDLFLQGYNEMLRRLKPSKVICYGKPFDEMKGNIIEVDYAKTNNLDKQLSSDNCYIKKIAGYVVSDYEKGMGGAGGSGTPTWKPKKLDDERLIGKPGEIKETFTKRGERFLTKIGENGYATKERQYTNHKKPHKHSNPHDHDIDWSKNFPDFGSPINYNDSIPEFKKYGGLTMSAKECIEFSKFDSIIDFRESILYGKEIEFAYNNKEYGVFYDGERYTFNEANKPETEIEFCSVDELLDVDVQGVPLREIITEVEVTWRNI